MMADQVRRLFEIIGKRCTAQGVFTLEQLPDAIARLRRAVEEEKQAAKLAFEEEFKEDAEDEGLGFDWDEENTEDEDLDFDWDEEGAEDEDWGFDWDEENTEDEVPDLVNEDLESIEKASDPDEEPISLTQRAFPMIRMMENALKTKGFITWEASKDF